MTRSILGILFLTFTLGTAALCADITGAEATAAPELKSSDLSPGDANARAHAARSLASEDDAAQAADPVSEKQGTRPEPARNHAPEPTTITESN